MQRGEVARERRAAGSRDSLGGHIRTGVDGRHASDGLQPEVGNSGAHGQPLQRQELQHALYVIAVEGGEEREEEEEDAADKEMGDAAADIC